KRCWGRYFTKELPLRNHRKSTDLNDTVILQQLEIQQETDDDLETSLEGSQDDYEGNTDAARALMRVKQKLDGYEEGEMRSIHGQVQQLIQDAIDPERLCQMFPGWGAWL
ncbi:Serine/threonine protein kinase, partial [Parasponia andersonii]